MRITDIDNFRPRNRKPWLLLVILLCAGAFFLVRSRTGKGGAPDATSTSEVVEEVVSAPPSDLITTGEVSIVSAVAPASNVSAGSLLKKAKALEAAMKLADARNSYTRLLSMGGIDPSVRKEVERRLGGINIDLVMTPAMMPEKETYIVKRGDSVDRIAKKFSSTVDLVKKGNNLRDANLIKSGDMMRVFTGRFALSISKSRRDMVVSMNGTFFKRYGVGTGKFGKTPVGTFVISDKIKEPVWWRPDGREVPFGEKENILGTRWMKLRPTGDTPPVKGYGIHGTWDDSSIGKAESAGCVRMRNREVEELFVLLPLGTKVLISE